MSESEQLHFVTPFCLGALFTSQGFGHFGPMAAKAKFDCLGLAIEWEANLQLRERIRDEKIVLKKEDGEPFVLPTRANAVSNSIVLLPLLERLSNTPKWSLPHLDDLEIEVRTLCEKCGLNPGEKGPYQISNEIKKMMVMIKRKARRQEVTKDNVVYFKKNIYGT